MDALQLAFWLGMLSFAVRASRSSLASTKERRIKPDELDVIYLTGV